MEACVERVCCLLVLNLVSSTLPCIRRPRPRLTFIGVTGHSLGNPLVVGFSLGLGGVPGESGTLRRSSVSHRGSSSSATILATPPHRAHLSTNSEQKLR
jgi:hypothetical protein